MPYLVVVIARSARLTPKAVEDLQGKVFDDVSWRHSFVLSRLPVLLLLLLPTNIVPSRRSWTLSRRVFFFFASSLLFSCP